MPGMRFLEVHTQPLLEPGCLLSLGMRAGFLLELLHLDALARVRLGDLVGLGVGRAGAMAETGKPSTQICNSATQGQKEGSDSQT